MISAAVDDPYRYQHEYRAGSPYAHIIGYLSIAHSSMTGIERARNGVLGGSDSAPAAQQIQETISGLHHKGGVVPLTLNLAVQRAATGALGDQRGAVVAINSKTGATLV